MKSKECIRIVALSAILLTRSARAGVVLDVAQVSPASRDVVITWAADAAAVPPLALLRRVTTPPRDMSHPPCDPIAGSVPLADVLPLDPSRDLAQANLAGSSAVLVGEMDALATQGVVAYQIVDAAGAHSNAGYVVRTAERSVPQPAFVLWTYVLRLPARQAIPDARTLLEHVPAAWSAVDIYPRPCVAAVTLERDGMGGFRGDNFSLVGKAGVGLIVSMPGAITYAGASAPTESDVVVRAQACDPACPDVDCAGILPMPIASASRLSVDVLCGRFFQDECTGGIFPGRGTVMVFSKFNEAFFCAGERGFLSQMARVAPIVGFQLAPSRAFEAQPDQAILFNSTEDLLVRASDAGLQSSFDRIDSDGDGRGDALEMLDLTDPLDASSHGPDWDRDGVPDDLDACPSVADPAQADRDRDGAGDACDACPTQADDACQDPDADGLRDGIDNCRDASNPSQVDGDRDTRGDACDNCPELNNYFQEDADADGIGDACDPCPDGATPDSDEDGVMDCLDNCPDLASADLDDPDSDGVGTPCDDCPFDWQAARGDTDADGLGDACDCSPSGEAFPSRAGPIRDLSIRRDARGEIDLAWARPPWPAIQMLDYGILGGNLDDLLAERGFASARCEGRLRENSTWHSEAPAPAWWLVRVSAACAVGSFSERVDFHGEPQLHPADLAAPECR